MRSIITVLSLTLWSNIIMGSEYIYKISSPELPNEESSFMKATISEDGSAVYVRYDGYWDLLLDRPWFELRREPEVFNLNGRRYCSGIFNKSGCKTSELKGGIVKVSYEERNISGDENGICFYTNMSFQLPRAGQPFSINYTCNNENDEERYVEREFPLYKK